MLQALSLSMFTGGLPLSQGIMHLGACVVPVGIEGGTRRVVDIARITRPHAIVATPSFGQYLIEDLNSTNATMLNRQRLQPGQPVAE